MLDFMRKHAQSWMIKVALGAVAVVFVFWGIWTPHEARDRDLVEIGGQSITIAEARNYYQNMRETYQSVYGVNFNEEMAKKLGLKERVVKELINKLLLLQEARRLKMSVSPEEVQASLQNNPAFQKDGLFDKATYLRALQRVRLNPQDFEASQKQTILMLKVQSLIASSAKVSDREVQDVYNSTFEKVNLDMLSIAPESQEVTLTPEDVKNYFAKHRDDFKIPPRAKIRYILFDPKDYAKQVPVTEKEIETYYQNNQDKFGQPKRVKIRHILIKADPKDKEGSAQARKKAESVREEAVKGKDFAQLAKQFSDDPGTKDRGGEIGFIARGQLVPEIEEAAFSMKAGGISNVIQTPYGLHIVKVDEVQEAKMQPLDKVKDQVQSQIRVRKGRELALDDADQAYSVASKEKALDGFAREKKITIRETGFFSAADKNDLDPKLRDSALALGKGDISPALRVGESYGVLQVVDKQESRVPELKEVEAQVSQVLRREKQGEKALAKGQDLLDKLRKGADLKALAAGEGLKIEETGFFERVSTPPKMEPSEDLRKAVSSLSQKSPYPEKPVPAGGKYVLFHLKETKAVDPEQFKGQKENFRRALLQQKQESLVTSWLDKLLEQAKSQGKFKMLKEANDAI